MADDEAEQETRRTLDVVQSMIDISAERLEGLRTQCATSAEITQQEIRTLEGKLIKMFSRQLVAKTKLPPDELRHIPSLTQWLQVVGLSSESIRGVCLRVSSLEELKEKTEHELRTILSEKNARPEEFGRLHRAMHNLRRYTEVLMRADKTNNGIEMVVDMPLYWDSWDHRQHFKNNLSPRVGRSRTTRASVPSEECLPNANNRTVVSGCPVSTLAASCSVSSINSLVLTPQQQQHCGHYSTTTPPLTPPVLSRPRWAMQGDRVKFPTTPPPKMKHKTSVQQSNVLLPDAYPLTKSQSHESQLAAGRGEGTGSGGDNTTTAELGGAGNVARRARLPTEPGPIDLGYNSPLVSSPIRSPPYSNSPIATSSVDCSGEDHKPTNASLQVPRSPRTPTVSRGMGHVIAHRFTKTFKMMTACSFCSKQMFGTGLKCKECKYMCHRECESKVPPSCGLPQELVDEFKKTLPDGMFHPSQSPSVLRNSSPNHHGSGLLSSLRHHSSVVSNKKHQVRHQPQQQQQQHHHHHHHHYHHHQQSQSNTAPFTGGPDSSSNTSSCNSSTPSSPALLATQTPHALTKQQFHFPDVRETTVTAAGVLCDRDVTVVIDSHSLLESTSTTGSSLMPGDIMSIGLHGQQDDDHQRNPASMDNLERTPVRVDSQDSQVSDGETVTNLDASCANGSDIADQGGHQWPRQNSLSMREWDIPFDELKIGEPIGTGRFGTVYRGNWHGDVAIKVLNMDYLDDEKTLETFRMEVGIFRKTRHENLMLFMGACMKPPRLAIVTSLSKGMTLYTHIHLRKDKINMNKTTIIAQQISQGMGYLHAKGIVHKDLKSRNIFLENGKVVIADFGLFSVTKLCYGGGSAGARPDSLGIPAGWLCYLAPEIVRGLRAHQTYDEELPFSKASDVYAFGTVWYELLCGEWPFKGQPPESIIWQVGKGMKQPLANLQASRDVKDILMLCWSFQPADRPDFITLLNTLDKLPKKRLARSPSHPVHLSRSAESVF